jgi:hypothetical protein
MPVLIKLNKHPLPENFLRANQVPTGKPITKLITVAIPETLSVSQVIAHTSVFPLRSNKTAS